MDMVYSRMFDQGINLAKNQTDVNQFIQHHNVGLVCLLESKVKASNIGSLYQRIFGGWCFISSNSSFHDGGRIIIAFKPGVMFIVRVLGGSSKALFR